MSFTDSLHCATKAHCWTCLNDLSWRIKVNGKDFSCPWGVTKENIPAILVPKNPMDLLGPQIWKRWHEKAESGEFTLDYVTYQMWREVPCGECKNHFLEARDKIPFRQLDQVNWMIEVHNFINQLLGKPLWT